MPTPIQIPLLPEDVVETPVSAAPEVDVGSTEGNPDGNIVGGGVGVTGI